MMVKKDNFLTCWCNRWSWGWMSKTAYKTRRVESASIDTGLYDNIAGITYSSLNVLTAKVRSVRPWSSRFNLVSQCLTTFQTWWSYFPTLEGDIPHRWDTWGPIALLESPNLVLISFCIAAILQFIFLNKCRCSGDVTVTSWGRVDCHIWWSGNWESQNRKLLLIPPLVGWSGSQEMLTNGRNGWIYNQSESSITP